MRIVELKEQTGPVTTCTFRDPEEGEYDPGRKIHIDRGLVPGILSRKTRANFITVMLGVGTKPRNSCQVIGLTVEQEREDLERVLTGVTEVDMETIDNEKLRKIGEHVAHLYNSLVKK